MPSLCVTHPKQVKVSNHIVLSTSSLTKTGSSLAPAASRALWSSSGAGRHARTVYPGRPTIPQTTDKHRKHRKHEVFIYQDYRQPRHPRQHRETTKRFICRRVGTRPGKPRWGGKQETCKPRRTGLASCLSDDAMLQAWSPEISPEGLGGPEGQEGPQTV